MPHCSRAINRAGKRQGWERLCKGGAPPACRGGGATSRKPRPPRLQGKSGPPAHLSGQPDGAGFRTAKRKPVLQVAFANRPRLVNVLSHKATPQHERVRETLRRPKRLALAPPAGKARSGWPVVDVKRLFRPRPAASPRAGDCRISMSGHPPGAEGAAAAPPKPDAGAPKK